MNDFIIENGILEKYIGKGGDVVIPDNVTSIGEAAFFFCFFLTSVSIPGSVTSIKSEAFSNCISLTSFTIPDSVTSIGEAAFGGCYGLKSINVSKNNSNYSSVDGVLFNKNKTELISYPAGITATSYVIPDSVTSIGNRAFRGCSNLKSITIPDSVKSIENGAFFSCNDLLSVNVSKNNSNYSSVDGVLFNKNQTELISYPAGITTASYVVPDSVTSIGDWAFRGCSNLKSITIPDSVKSIENGAFENCSSITSVMISDGVSNIGKWAFSDCTSLTSVSIPDGVTSIGVAAFSCCTNLTSINVSKGNSKYSSVSGVLFNKNKTELISYPAGITTASYVVPDSVTSIGDWAFRSCHGLKSVTVPDSVTSIEGRAFCGCTSLKSVSIPDSVTSIGDDAFFGCEELIIKTTPGSFAEEYAMENYIPFKRKSIFRLKW